MENVKFQLDYSKDELIIAGEPDAMCWLRNVVADAARYHDDAGRHASADLIWKLWYSMYEEKERKEI